MHADVNRNGPLLMRLGVLLLFDDEVLFRCLLVHHGRCGLLLLEGFGFRRATKEDLRHKMAKEWSR